MIEALALVFAAYAAYTAWPWWSATIVGALCGFQVANARMYQSASKESGASGNSAVPSGLFKASLIGIVAGAAIATAAYFLARLILSS